MIAQPSIVDVPLTVKPDGSIRIGETRVLLELIIRAFHRGGTPESIVDSYPSLQLDEVYAVIAYYLQNRGDVDAYVAEVDDAAQRIRRQIEANQPQLASLRARLLNKLAEKRE